MLGFSMYLSRVLTADDYNYLIAMRNAGFNTVFTSICVDEDANSIKNRLNELVKWCKNLDLEIIADVTADCLKKLEIDISDVGQVQSLNLTGLRIDDGVKMETIAKLSKSMPIALNASTISEEDLVSLKEYNAAFDHLEAWHNFYPHPETGLAADWLKEKNEWLHSKGLKTMAFAPGDDKLEGPICESLPTLEKQRHENPLAAMLELKKLSCDYVFIGDAGLKHSTIDSFENYLKKQIITLHVDHDMPKLFENEWHNRPDVARDVIRLKESRSLQLFETTPQEPEKRLKGSITCDNDKYLRYKGEIQITKRDLPANDKVNVIGHIVKDDVALLDEVGANTQIMFVKA